MKSVNIYTIFIIICIIVIILVNYLINKEYEETTNTPYNIKQQPCPDYYEYNINNGICTSYDANDNASDTLDTNDMTFCEKQTWSKQNDTVWNGISNIYNPRCEENTEISGSVALNLQSTLKSDNNEPVYIHNIFYYSISISILIGLEIIFRVLLNIKNIFIIFVLFLFIIDSLLYSIIGWNIQYSILGEMYTKPLNKNNEYYHTKQEDIMCYEWSCFDE